MYFKKWISIIFISVLYQNAFSQFSSLVSQASSVGSSFGRSAVMDSFQERNYLLDSIPIQYSTMASKNKIFSIDTSLQDIAQRLRFETKGLQISNDGSPLLLHVFEPNNHIGWNSGSNLFEHLFYTEKNVRFFKSMFPYSQVSYLFGTNESQGISFLYSQNINSRLNFGTEFRSFSSPGFFKNQNTYHYSFYAYLQFESVNKFYKFTGAYIENEAQASTNGGVKVPNNIRNGTEVAYFNRALFPVNLGDNTIFTTNLLSNALSLGNKQAYKSIFFSNLFTFGAVKKLIIVPPALKKTIGDSINFSKNSNDFSSSQSTTSSKNNSNETLPKNDTTIRYYRIPTLTIEYVFKNNVTNNIFKHNSYQSDSLYYKELYPQQFYISKLKKENNLILDEKWDNYHHNLIFTFYPQQKNLQYYFLTSFEIISSKKIGTLFKDSILKNLNYTHFQIDAEFNRTFNEHTNLYVKGSFFKFDSTFFINNSNNTINYSLYSKFNFSPLKNLFLEASFFVKKKFTTIFYKSKQCIL